MNNRSKLFTDRFGTKCWLLNGKMHREDGPAIEYADGSKEWYINGKRHRIDGPAVECVDGKKAWYLNGKLLTQAEWFSKLTPEQQENYIWNLDDESIQINY
jgi:hypothetical protein